MHMCICSFYLTRDPPEPTGDEGEDADFDAPKVYEPVSLLFLYNMLVWFVTQFFCQPLLIIPSLDSKIFYIVS